MLWSEFTKLLLIYLDLANTKGFILLISSDLYFNGISYDFDYLLEFYWQKLLLTSQLSIKLSGSS